MKKIWQINQISEESFEILVNSASLALYVHIYSNQFDFIASDNFFSLNKGESYKIILNFKEKISLDEFKDAIIVASLYDMIKISN